MTAIDVADGAGHGAHWQDKLGDGGRIDCEIVANRAGQWAKPSAGCATFPFGSSREVDIGYATVRATQMAYVGELGWGLYVPVEQTSRSTRRCSRRAWTSGLRMPAITRSTRCG